jgi:hypothetical protein
MVTSSDPLHLLLIVIDDEMIILEEKSHFLVLHYLNFKLKELNLSILNHYLPHLRQ